MKQIFTSALIALGLLSGGSATPANAQAQPLMGTIMWTGYSFCPRGWADATGGLLPIAQNTALFSLYGTMYGGDGRTTMALPNLAGRSPVSEGRGPGLSDYRQGALVGLETTTMTIQTMPSHNHTGNGVASSGPPDSTAASGLVLGAGQFYSARSAPDQTMGAGSVQINSTGGSQPFNNMQPFLVLRPCVAVQGTYPSRS